MTTKLELSRTGDDPAARITQDLLNARATLPPVANGKPPRVMDARVAYHRNEIGAGKMTPVHTILGIVREDLKSSPALLAEHLAWIDRLRATVEAMGVSAWMQRREEPIQIQLVRESLKETAAQGKADPAQERMIVDLNNLASVDAFITHGERHHAQLGTVLRLAHQLRVEKGDISKRVYGARRHA